MDAQFPSQRQEQSSVERLRISEMALIFALILALIFAVLSRIFAKLIAEVAASVPAQPGTTGRLPSAILSLACRL